MGEPEILIGQLRRSNRRWKTLALAACAALALVVLFGSVITARHQVQAERQRAQAEAALARAARVAVGQPR